MRLLEAHREAARANGCYVWVAPEGFRELLREVAAGYLPGLCPFDPETFRGVVEVGTRGARAWFAALEGAPPRHAMVPRSPA